MGVTGTSYRRDSLVVRTSRCGRDIPGSNPGHGKAALCWQNLCLVDCLIEVIFLFLVKGKIIDNCQLVFSGCKYNASANTWAMVCQVLVVWDGIKTNHHSSSTVIAMLSLSGCGNNIHLWRIYTNMNKNLMNWYSAFATPEHASCYAGVQT